MNEMPAIDRMLAESRVGLDRVHASDLEREMAEGALVVDTRPVDQRERDGDLPGAVVIDRNVLEWRLDPSRPTGSQSQATLTAGSWWCATRATVPASLRTPCNGLA